MKSLAGRSGKYIVHQVTILALGRSSHAFLSHSCVLKRIGTQVSHGNSSTARIDEYLLTRFLVTLLLFSRESVLKQVTEIYQPLQQINTLYYPNKKIPHLIIFTVVVYLIKFKPFPRCLQDKL